MEKGDVVITARHEYAMTIRSIDGDAVTANHFDKWGRLCQDVFKADEILSINGEPATSEEQGASSVMPEIKEEERK